MPRSCNPRSAQPLFLLCLLVFCWSCSGGPKAELEPAPSSPDTSDEPARVVPEKIELPVERSTLRAAMYVPAPSEFEAALVSTGAKLSLGPLVKDEPRPLEGMNQQLLALETGTRVTNAVVSVRPLSRTVLVWRVGAAREGLVALGAPATVLEAVDGFVKECENGNLNDTEVVAALDLVAQTIHGGLEQSVDASTSTLVRAGGWVQAAHLVATALVSAPNGASGAHLLRQPGLIDYFQLFLRSSEAGRAQDPRIGAVLERMDELKWLAGQETMDQDQLFELISNKEETSGGVVKRC